MSMNDVHRTHLTSLYYRNLKGFSEYVYVVLPLFSKRISFANVEMFRNGTLNSNGNIMQFCDQNFSKLFIVYH